ncbi:MAG: hypothetical protein QG622_3643 [Actinomycetota bacterium]|nr:hypothetical protein [Actinomycetota bacterium]
MTVTVSGRYPRTPILDGMGVLVPVEEDPFGGEAEPHGPEVRGPGTLFLVWHQPEGASTTDNRTLRRRCTHLVDGLTIPEPFDLDVFCEQLGRDRGRPISRLVLDLPDGGPCGLLISTDDAEIVLVERRTNEWHQRHIVLHELGHLLWGHDRVTTGGTSKVLFPHLDPSTVQTVLGRTAYSALEERQAEMVASLILERVSRPDPEVRWSTAPRDPEALRRVEESLSGRRSGWAGSRG